MQNSVCPKGCYKDLILQELKTRKLEHEADQFIQFFQRYWIGRDLAVPPWAETDIAFFLERIAVLNQLIRDLGGQEIPACESQAGWLPFPERWQWVRLIDGECVLPQIYFTCNLRKRGTPDEQAELQFLRAQCPVEILIDINDIGTDFRSREEIAEFYRELIRDHVDILIFSEYRVEYGQFIGFGVYSEIQEAKRKGIPIFLLRDEQFWMNPCIEIRDGEDLVCHAQVCVTPHPPLRFLEDLFYLGEI